MKTFLNSVPTLLLAATVLSGLVGCESDSRIGYVSGRVTLNDQPVENATITFAPTKGGSPSNARTDSDGTYELRYTRASTGAEIGEHRVIITTQRAANPDADPPVQGVPEVIPAKYNAKTELVADVKSGSNQFDFQLQSERTAANVTNRR